MDLKTKIEKALRAHLQLEHIDLKDEDGVYGYVVADEFRGIPHIDRQIAIASALRKPPGKLSKAEQRRIVIIAALTPVEYAALGPEATRH